MPSEFQYQEELQQNLASCPNLRIMKDTIPEHLLFVYQYITDILLQFAQRELHTSVRKSILHDALVRLADLHKKGIIHTGKPFNVPKTKQKIVSLVLIHQRYQTKQQFS
jgi:hypothetical protein